MSLTFYYGLHAVTLPKIDRAFLERAGKAELALLLALASEPALMADYETNADLLAEDLSLTRAELDSALTFLLGAGMVRRRKQVTREQISQLHAAAPKATAPAAEPAVTVPKRTVTTELPRYTADELERVMKSRKNAAHLVDEAQKALGLIFTSHSQISQLIGIAEGLSLSDEYILLLLAHCRDKGKNNLRYAEKLAVSLVDADITTPDALSEHLHALELAESAEGKIKRLFGFSRTLTGKEKGFVADWTGKFGFGEDMIQKAYEFAVEATANPTLNYVNSILLRWHEDGITTPDAADRDREKHRGAADEGKTRTKKGGKASKTNHSTPQSFDVDDFFAAAMSRGYGGDPS